MQVEASGQACSDCGARFSQSALACPSCQKLVHAEALKDIAIRAREAAARGDSGEELRAWRSALQLLPPESRQHNQVDERVAMLTRVVDEGGAAPARNRSAKRVAGASALGVLLLKFKGVLLFLLAKAKFLLFGLTKLQTLLSMLLTVAVYFGAYGWKYALGFVLSIYVHEMGHVAALAKFGIPASAPMFVPGFGAFVRLHQYPSTPAEDARVGLAGPIWGLGAALSCAALYLVTRSPLWGALAHTGAYINLFNLIPVWQLDGSRGFNALTKNQRLIASAVIFLAWLATHELLLLLILGVALMRAFGKNVAPKGDARALVEYAVLILALAWLARPQLAFVPNG
jgi:Zn-dependent protease